MKTLYFHIGTSKTGTTAIQSFCYKNRDILKNKGIIYPISMGGIPSESFEFTDGNLGDNLSACTSLEEKAKKIYSLISNNEKTLISSERIWFEIKDKQTFFNI